jgi:hypothetical protein
MMMIIIIIIGFKFEAINKYAVLWDDHFCNYIPVPY